MSRGNVCRREFIAGVLAGMGLRGAGAASAPEVDEGLSVFISDPHVSGRNVRHGNEKDGYWYQRTYMIPTFFEVVDEILAMRPRPRRVVCFGDVALYYGCHEDYEESLPGFEKLKAAGIEVYVTAGNHDRRDVMFRYHPRQAALTPVPGRFVSVVDLGTCDLILLDTLQETGSGEGTSNAVGGAMDEVQWDWLREESRRRTRPFLCGSHHAPIELRREVAGKTVDVLSVLNEVPFFRGWVNGHVHFWGRFIHRQGRGRRLIRRVELPSVGFWGDLGYAVMRTFADRAELTLVERDFHLYEPLDGSAVRPQEWSDIVREKNGQKCVFFY